MQVIKRDGRVVNFNQERIVKAITMAMAQTTGGVDIDLANKIATAVERQLEDKNQASVYEIQDLVEKTLIEYNLPEIAKHYILYRNQRSKVRSIHSEMNKAIAQLVDPVADSDDKRENANINSDTTINKPVAC